MIKLTDPIALEEFYQKATAGRIKKGDMKWLLEIADKINEFVCYDTKGDSPKVRIAAAASSVNSLLEDYRLPVHRGRSFEEYLRYSRIMDHIDDLGEISNRTREMHR